MGGKAARYAGLNLLGSSESVLSDLNSICVNEEYKSNFGLGVTISACVQLKIVTLDRCC